MTQIKHAFTNLNPKSDPSAAHALHTKVLKAIEFEESKTQIAPDYTPTSGIMAMITFQSHRETTGMYRIEHLPRTDVFVGQRIT
jgi:hypothetical protein